MAVQREKVIQADGVSLLKSIGGAVYVSGTRRGHVRCRKCGSMTPEHYGTRQTPGIPDVLAFLPAKRGYRDEQDLPTFVGPLLLFWEAKAPGGRLSPEQKAFQLHCQTAGIPHVVGDLDALIAWLCERGYCSVTQFPFYRQPKAATA